MAASPVMGADLDYLAAGPGCPAAPRCRA